MPFKKGISGNPAGKPKGALSKKPSKKVLMEQLQLAAAMIKLNSDGSRFRLHNTESAVSISETVSHKTSSDSTVKLLANAD